VGQIGVRGGGFVHYAGGEIGYDPEVLGGPVGEHPPTPRVVNMNRLGAALDGEVTDPPIMALYVFAANPVVSAPNTGRIVRGLRREDLFTVVHDLFLTDTARLADIVLPATSQLEHTDFHEAYGHNYLQYNAPAIAPLGEAKSNWDVMRLLAAAMGYDEPWLRETPDEIIANLLATSRGLSDITLERLKSDGTVRHLPPDWVPFADGRFPTPSGKVELRSDALAAAYGVDPLPGLRRAGRAGAATARRRAAALHHRGGPPLRLQQLRQPVRAGGQGADHPVARDPPRGRGAARHHRRRLGHGRQRAGALPAARRRQR
jgi:anaerobic selenocysteine-containing dehydrogenase